MLVQHRPGRGDKGMIKNVLTEGTVRKMIEDVEEGRLRENTVYRVQLVPVVVDREGLWEIAWDEYVKLDHTAFRKGVSRGKVLVRMLVIWAKEKALDAIDWLRAGWLEG